MPNFDLNLKPSPISLGVAKTTPTGGQDFTSLYTTSNPAATNPAKSAYIASKTAISTAPAVLAPKTYTTPSGAVVDSTGRLVSGPSTGGGTDTSTPAPGPSAADVAFENYLKSLQPSAATTEAQKYVQDLTTQSQLAQEKALGTGDTLGFAAGEAQRVGRNFDIKLAGAAAIADMQANLDANRQNISKARYEYEQKKIDDAKAELNKGFELSPGQTRFDSQGNPIASLPATPKAPASEKPLSIVDIKRIEDLYGFTPPLGATMSEITQFVNDNPGASPQKLQEGIDAAFSNIPQPESSAQFLNEDYFRKLPTDVLKKYSDKAGTSKWYTGASKDVSRFITELNTKVEDARKIGWSDQEILDYLVSNNIIPKVQ